jgi:hypothetical protein
MAKIKKKGEPELLLVSFCDIVTITTAALFMAMVVVIDQASKTPIYRPTPIAISTTNEPVFFECRANQLYPIDHTRLANLLQVALTNARAREPEGPDKSMKAIASLLSQDIGDHYYAINPGFLMMNTVAISPRPNVQGITVNEMDEKTNRFATALGRLSRASQYPVFLVRDDSFAMFRKARELVVSSGFLSGWEFLERDEPITFVGMFAHIKVQ